MPKSSTELCDSSDSSACSGISRRNFLRIATAASAVVSVPFFTEGDLAHATTFGGFNFSDPTKGVHIDANENPMGPSDTARSAAAAMIPMGGRYFVTKQEELIDTFAKAEGLQPEYVAAFAGSTEPLVYTTLAFTSKDNPLVTADPGYEAPMWAAQSKGSSVIKVPLADPKGAATHDVKAMLAASAAPGVIYICNPNNPTGTITSRKDIEYLVANAPKGSIVLIDEAYIHFSDATPSLDFVKEGKDVVVLRTFSKLYGMAGLRMGFAIARPDILAKITALGGKNSIPITAAAAATASLCETDLVATRKKTMATIREENLSWLQSEGYQFTPSQSNCFMLDVKRPGAGVIAAMAQKGVFIGRIWPAWPNHVRISVGSRQDMAGFQKAFKEVMAMPASAAAHLTPAMLPEQLRDSRLIFLS